MAASDSYSVEEDTQCLIVVGCALNSGGAFKAMSEPIPEGSESPPKKSGRGGKREGAGRPKGSPNKVTREVRAALKKLVEDNVGEMEDWFKRQWKSDDGGKVAATLLSRLIEFAAPKLQRTDHAPQPDAAKSVDEMTDAELEAIAHESPAAAASRVYSDLMQGRMTAEVATKVLATTVQRDAVRTAATEGAGADAIAAQAPEATPPPPTAPLALPPPADEPQQLTPAMSALLDMREPVPLRQNRQSEPAAPPAPATPAAPFEGEVMPSELTPHQLRCLQYKSDLADWQRRAKDYTETERQRRGIPYWAPNATELDLAIGPKPQNPAAGFRLF